VTDLTIVSGGQTGVDRAALDEALAAGIACGGWCPRGRQAEDGRIAECYPLREMASSDYAERTRQNVIDSDGTLILAAGPLSGGTALTRSFCRRERKPYRVIDAAIGPSDQAGVEAAAFVKQHGIRVLNVAGPRASSDPEIYAYTRQTVAAMRRALFETAEP